uniref:EF-hand domain-containing protein n=1 Tax=Daphnia galeata TaxID=27404 RepID=A0A8J2WFA8_9CRUS|nr:unnamed protein product [Daphnia galeata]
MDHDKATEQVRNQNAFDMGSNCGDTNSEAESISEEERVRRLFAVCDADGDGYIDSEDLVSALQELGLEGAINVSDLMQQMGADTQGKVSYEQFLQCRLSHRTEIEALRVHSGDTNLPSSGGWINANDLSGLYSADIHLPTSSEHSLGATSLRHESWEFDSGARDLSPEPNALYKLIEAAGVSLTANPSQILEIANKLHLAALGSLRGEISELHARLQRAAQDRDTLEQALAKTQLERLRLVQESEERLERQSTQYEERLTELHSVIAELTRKLNRQQYNVIKEEGEEEETEDDEDEEGEEDDDADNDGEEENKTKRSNPEVKGAVERPTDVKPEATNRNKRAEEVGYSLLKDGQDVTEEEPEADASSSCSSDLSFGASSSDEDGVGPAGEANQAGEDDLDAKAVQAGENLDQFLSSTAKEASATIADPLTAFSSENKELKVEILRLGQDLNQAQGVVDALRMERDELRRQLEMSQQPRPLPLSAAASMGALSIQGSPIHQRMASSRVSSPVVVEEGPVCKVAERVRIRRLDGRDKLLTGSQIASFGIRDARVAEQLVCSVHQDSVQGEAHHASGAEIVRVNELELEVERLASRSEHLRAQNDVLSMTLAESRALGERLAVLLGKYESNCMALRMALERADRVSEAFEVLAALVESEMSLLLANCQVAGLGLTGRGGSAWETESGGNSKDLSVLWKRATERRRSAENLARSLLSKYDRERDNWEDTGRHTNTTSSTSSGAESGSGSGSNPACTLEPTERKVRDIIGRLKGDRASLENTVQQVSLPLESVLVDPLPKEVLPLAEARKIDLEMAVIMQELMAMREERSRLRTQVYILEKERAAHEAQHQATAAQLRSLNTAGSSSEASGERSLPLVEGADGDELTVREKRLQLKIQELTGALERVTSSAELRSQQSAELVSDVKKANATLVQLLERTKKKYQSRLKRLEQQMVNMSERHAMQVRVLKQRVLVLEDESSVRPLPLSSAPSETSL